MSYFNRRYQHVVAAIEKKETAGEPILKADSEPMQQSTQAQQASSAAYSTQYTAPPPVQEQIKAHKAAASAHVQAAKGHRVSGKAAMQASPTVGAAHFQQAQMHDRMAQDHGQQAQSMQDQQDCGYR